MNVVSEGVTGRASVGGEPVGEASQLQDSADWGEVFPRGYTIWYKGGMTAETITNSVYEFRINHEHKPARLEWK